MTRQVLLASADHEIDRCYPVMVQLRPHIRRQDFVGRVRNQMQAGYRLAYLEEDTRIGTVTGFRVDTNLAWGKHLYVDDLVVDEHARSRGSGRVMFDWLIDYARDAGCGQLHLDSGVQRFRAHRFYLRAGMDIVGHHFSLTL